MSAGINNQRPGSASGDIEASEMRYRRLFETARDGILILDANSRKITDANPFMVELLEYSREEFIGKELWQIGLLKDEEASKAAFRELRDKGYIRYEDLPLESKTGQRREIEFVSNVYTEGYRQVIQCNIRDITERKAAKDLLTKLTTELDLAASHYRRVLSNSLDVICQINQAGQFIQASPATRAVWGYEPEELIGRMFMDFVCLADRIRTAQAVADIMTGKQIGPFENCYQTSNGSLVNMMWSVSWSESEKTMFCVGRDVSQIKEAEEALKESEANYRSLVESSPAIVYLSEATPPYSPVYISPGIKEFGYTPGEWLASPDLWINRIHDDDRERVLGIADFAMKNDLNTEIEYRILARDGEIHWVQDKGHFISDWQGNKKGWQGVMVDITKTKELEGQLRQSQKLESVGRLAGGIAHDFNNMLTAIIGYSDLTLSKMHQSDPLRRNIEEIKKAGHRSADLTQQLLAFSRQQILKPKILSINKVITDTSRMLERLIGEDIQLVAILNPATGAVRVDPGQLSQIIMNLAVNARDAMPQGGKLTFETDNVTLSQDYAKHHVDVIPGNYVMMAVSDSGTGMSAETQRKIFEPFFTTKEVGKGTGLGLATVYGVVSQSGGNIWLYSELGVGTTFKIYLPLVADQSEAIELRNTANELPRGMETVLLVEDDDILREMSHSILEMAGYTVLEAGNGIEALSISRDQDLHIDLLMTDVVMPQMGGRELAEKLGKLRPDMRILFTSGYTDDAIVLHGVIESDTNFIQKPFSISDLANKVRNVLDADRHNGRIDLRPN